MGERHRGQVLHEQVKMVLFSVELGQGRPEVRLHLRHDVFAQVAHLRGEHATPIPGEEHQVNLVIVDDGATAPTGLVPAGVS